MVDVYFKFKILGKNLVRVGILKIIRAGAGRRGRAPFRRRFTRSCGFYAFFWAWGGGAWGWGSGHNREHSLGWWFGVWWETGL